MKDLHKRFALFLGGCIGTRLLLAYLIKKNFSKLKYILVLILTIIGCGFLFIYFNDMRKTGGEVFGDKIWWNDLRPLHGCLYLFSAILLMLNFSKTYMIIVLDTIIGLSAFSYYHISNTLK